ncbi:pyridoxal phosphate-dependent class II aminotransferase [Desulfococcaceae bacterium HSG9]|nr:pyridoxal phosphate-dependent class II aminotransferase [Desulfococcaceae bacterium HSG9]
MIIGHGGNIDVTAKRIGCLPYEIIDMSSNINPLGTMPGLLDFLKQNIACASVLPEADAGAVQLAFARRYDVNSRQVLAGNGVTQFIYALPLVLKTKRALILGPTYADYADACKMQGAVYEYCHTLASEQFQYNPDKIDQYLRRSDTVFICNPNNPTGTMIPKTTLIKLCQEYPDIRFVVDESYLPFVSNGEQESMLGTGLTNVIVFNSMSKIFAVPGLRIGFMVAAPSVIQKFQQHWPPWSVNSLAQKAILWLMQRKDATDSFIRQTVRFVLTEKEQFAALLKDNTSIRQFPSSTGFMLAQINGNKTAADVSAKLLQHKILIRNCANFEGLSENYFRVALKSAPVNRILAEGLSALT